MNSVPMRPAKRSWPFSKWVTGTAVIGFLVTNTAAYFMGRVGDNILDNVGSPLHVEVMSVPSSSLFGVMFEGRSPDEVPRPRLPNADAAVMNWAETAGGLPADNLGVRVLVWADHPVVLNKISVDKRECSDAASGTSVKVRGGGRIDPRPVSFQLDAESSDGIPQEDEAVGVWEFPLWVADSETESFSLVALAGSKSCVFDYVFHYQDDGKDETYVFDNDNEHFEVASDEAVTGELYWEVIEGNYVHIVDS